MFDQLRVKELQIFDMYSLEPLTADDVDKLPSGKYADRCSHFIKSIFATKKIIHQ